MRVSERGNLKKHEMNKHMGFGNDAHKKETDSFETKVCKIVEQN